MSGTGVPQLQHGRLRLLSGPNLNLLGEREPAVYGTTTLAQIVEEAAAEAARYGVDLDHVQSNHEGVLIDAVHAARSEVDAVVINPGAFTHYAWGLHDALAAFDGPILEVHLSNPQRREAWRHTSVVAPVATGTISGLGAAGYVLAVRAVAGLLGLAEET
ncbi:MAG: 3-dehydroquinate dehydratase [Acidimicrobiia bacterium]|nr:3-dehydroquinate dehydratase [Acidimicrobiia bacterium]